MLKYSCQILCISIIEFFNPAPMIKILWWPEKQMAINIMGDLALLSLNRVKCALSGLLGLNI